ncbi:hypothetical protein HOU70_gp52 [Arthrobacter phage Liebe]|uniref:Uncharacterized protein n=2 Tax=Arthrobacter virus Liebe TaxID=2734245 RepID=A0A3G2KHS3_9CAUD|nr:hypothetical protein HOU70_gp52 [Arthrobacter phage Liebe]AYN58533.1 hypothetical protein PBI_MAUREEN_52 [Arthrobacter phage Maureen]AZF93785.1 hypothetical protein PBI_LIEBE_52 [Arthrobacter phage Liebe]
MATDNDFRQQAIAALDKSRAYAPNTPARLALLSEATVLALLALDAPAPVQPEIVFPEPPFPVGPVADDAPPAPATRSRKRKAPAAKPDAEADADAEADQ